MNNNVKKIILGVVGGIIILFMVDLICIFTINRPLLAIKQDDNDPVGIYYRGLLYNTVLCYESSKPQIYLKGFGVGCPINSKKVENYKLIDKTKNKLNFACDEEEQKFYEDENFIYYWECMKDSYMIVQYDNGYKETISEALKQKHIDIQDLDKFEIFYIKEIKDLFETFDAKIIETKENSITVEVLKNSKFYKKNDKLTIGINRPEDKTNDFYIVGNKVRITFNEKTSNSTQNGGIKIESINK